ncbi:MAG TPA: hypothetical protein GX711_05915, partial [Clostridia bacterium]|nr:hypothetical protein [Clostridia bacterium]
PSLSKLNFALRIFREDDSLKDFTYSLKEKLQDRGALVLVDWENKINPALFRALKAPVVFSFALVPAPQLPSLGFYYSFLHHEASLNIITEILKELTENNSPVTFEVVKTMGHLYKIHYCKMLNETNLPSILVEIRNPDLISQLNQDLQCWIVQSLLRKFGSPETQEKIQMIIQLYREWQGIKESQQKAEAIGTHPVSATGETNHKRASLPFPTGPLQGKIKDTGNISPELTRSAEIMKESDPGTPAREEESEETLPGLPAVAKKNSPKKKNRFRTVKSPVIQNYSTTLHPPYEGPVYTFTRRPLPQASVPLYPEMGKKPRDDNLPAAAIFSPTSQQILPDSGQLSFQQSFFEKGVAASLSGVFYPLTEPGSAATTGTTPPSFHHISSDPFEAFKQLERAIKTAEKNEIP